MLRSPGRKHSVYGLACHSFSLSFPLAFALNFEKVIYFLSIYFLIVLVWLCVALGIVLHHVSSNSNMLL